MIKIVKTIKRSDIQDRIILNASFHRAEPVVAYRAYLVADAPERPLKLFEFKTRSANGREHVCRINASPGIIWAEHVKGKSSAEPQWIPIKVAATIYFCGPSVGKPESANAAIVLFAHVRDMHDRILFAFELAVREQAGPNWATARRLTREELSGAVEAWQEAPVKTFNPIPNLRPGQRETEE